MKGSKWILILAALLVAAAVSSHADEYAMPLDKTVGPGLTHVKYDAIVYHIIADADCTVRFEEIDSKHVKLTVKPAKAEVLPYCELSIQWSSFPAALLPIGPSDGNSWLLNTETGYAEK